MAADLAFLLRDVRRQRELAQQALDEAKRIDEILKVAPATPNRDELVASKQKWLEMARELAENANTTSQAGSTSITIASPRLF
jgi:hypothetical protein